MAILQCETCYELTFESCSAQITVEGLLANNTLYEVNITDKHNNVYVQDATSNGTGDIIIDLSVYNRSFVPSSGAFVLKFLLAGVSASFTINSIIYDCLLLRFVKTT